VSVLSVSCQESDVTITNIAPRHGGKTAGIDNGAKKLRECHDGTHGAVRAKFHCAIWRADRFEAGRRPAARAR